MAISAYGDNDISEPENNNNVVQPFRPNQTGANFHRPQSDMNVASGCPKFAPLSILDNP